MRLISLLIFIPMVAFADIVEICKYEGMVRSEPGYVAGKITFTYQVGSTATPKFNNEYGAEFNEVCSDTVGKIIDVEISAVNGSPLLGLAKGASYNLAAWYNNGGSPFMYSILNDD
jgi:hypothetical protein